MGIFLPGEVLTADRLNERTIDVIGGQIRGTTIGTIVAETVWATAATLPCRALSTYTAEADARWGNNVVDEQFAFRIRDTNLVGTILADMIAKGFGGGPYAARSIFTFTTTTATTRTFVATCQRAVSISGGNAGVNPNSRLHLLRNGDSGVYSVV